jgi:type VI secretion system protein ImpI
MPLRLKIVSAHRESMGGAYIQEFKSCGGTIGRSLECDWPLPDAKRFLSSKHAMINFQDNCYYLVDLSRNGVYINGSTTPLGNGNPQRLFDDDKIRIGEYEIQIAIYEDDSEDNPDRLTDSVIRAQLVQEDESLEIPMIPSDHMQDSAPLEMMLTPGGNPGELSSLIQMPMGKITMLNDAANHGVIEAAELFLHAAGMDPKEFQGIEPKMLLENAARLLAGFAAGTNELLAAKDAMTKGLNIPDRNDKQAINPLRSADDIATGLRLLLSGKNDVNLSGIDAINAAYGELLRHQQALNSAMHDADQPRPQELDEEFDKQFARAFETETSD